MFHRSEASIEQSACTAVLARFGVESRKLTTPGHSGTMDRMFLIPGGRPLLIEFKKPGEQPRPLQLAEHALWKKLGYDVEVHDTVEGAVEAVRRALIRAMASAAEVLDQNKPASNKDQQ